ncbi:MAG: metal-dependent hydrolase, partial [Candidatus Bathyarchaeota archaeon]|nr:metal-dependent hydrolase [Candidatus Bathyarchaeota archaeon]
HLALGYITGKVTSKLLNVNVNIPLLFVASVISDIDLLIPGLEHRGPTHSLIITTLLFLPTFIIYRKKATPYFIATTQHFILGDCLTGGGGIQLLWPATVQWYGIGFEITSLTNILTEWTFLLTSLTIMHKTKDMRTLFQHHPSNLLLSIPIFTVLLPTLLSIPLSVPPELIIPHLAYLTIFTISVLIDLKPNLK